MAAHLPFYEIEILTKAVQFKNLSAASQQIGLSQPQLSRIVAKLEQEFQIPLLDRSSKRHTTWSAAARELAKTFDSMSQRLQEEILRTGQNAEMKTIKVGSLEGLALVAIDYCEKIVKYPHIQNVHLDIYDVNELEKAFVEGQLDMILTQREPGRKKYKYSKLLGYQILKFEGKNSEYEILSEYQLSSQKVKKNAKPTRKLISNSLMVRKLWIEKGLGKGRIPSGVYKSLPKDSLADDKPEEVLLLANDYISEKLWKLF